MTIDTTLNNNQIKKFSLTISIDDVLNCIKKDYDGYLNFLNEELKDNAITLEEYNKELMLIDRLKLQQNVEGELIWERLKYKLIL